MIEALVAGKVVLIVAWFGVLALGERLQPAAPRPPGEARVARNLAFWAANAAINPFIIVPISVAAASFDLWSRPALGFWPGLALDLILLDLWTYFWHRANHQWGPLWRFHRVHHLDQFLDSTAAVRFHPGEVLISALARTPLIMLADIPIGSLVLFDTALLAAALFHHSNLRLPPALEAALRLLIVTPSHHWVHHHPGSDTNSNYGTVLTLWDRLFRSWSPTARTRELRIGLGEPDRSLLDLVAAPIRRAPGPGS